MTTKVKKISIFAHVKSGTTKSIDVSLKTFKTEITSTLHNKVDDFETKEGHSKKVTF